MIIQRRFQGFSLKTFSQLIIINLIYSIEIFVEPTVRVFEAFFIRYGVNTYSCMRSVSLYQLFTENNENQDERIFDTASHLADDF